MILIFLSWIYIVFTTINLGFILDRILFLKNKNFVITSFLGLFSITILASIWAIFGRINVEFHVFITVINLLLLINFKNKIFTNYKHFYLELRELTFASKIYLLFILVLTLAHCSNLPIIVDNESYYIQTIKWLNEYGFVKGLINLHFFFGQTSGWHITQSALNLSFLYPNFNDLSGYCLLLGMVFSIQKLNMYFKNKNHDYLLIGLVPITSLFLFQFISAPSPDLAVYILSFIVLFYFLENFRSCSKENFNLIVLFTIYLLYIKYTTVTLLLIPVFLYLCNYNLLRKNMFQSVVISTIVLTLLIIKNMIICGSPLFPFKLFDAISMQYAVPDQIENSFYRNIREHNNFLTFDNFSPSNAYQAFLDWLKQPKLHGLFNKIGVFFMIVTPLFIGCFQNKKKYWFLFLLMLIQFMILFLTSPQYRFFMNFILFFSLFCIVCIIKNKNSITALLYLSLIPVVILLFIPLSLTRFTNNKFMAQTSLFTVNEIIFPLENTKTKTDYEIIEMGNLKYNSPLQNDFFYGNGNGDLPCVNKTQVEYYRKHFNVIPQMRTEHLKDGFYSKNITADE